ncbi:MAG: DUF547 domain-containing protein [Phycisphaerae bacterium]|nr:DUF547 domain-containing protein [Phycisphaerae bacterium]
MRLLWLSCLGLGLGPGCGGPAVRPAPDSIATEAQAPTQAEGDATAADLPQWTRRWGKLLDRSVSSQTGRVNYARLRRQRGELDALVKALASKRQFANRRQKLAFLINAYNVLVFAEVVAHPPVTSVRRIDGFLSERRCQLLGQKHSLNAIRDELIRPMADPRALLAINHAALGSAPLRNRPYTAEGLDSELDEQCRRFVNDPLYNTQVSGQALLSPLFQWFDQDFAIEPYGGTLAFIARYAHPRSSIGRLLRSFEQPPVIYLEFNWSLNGAD